MAGVLLGWELGGGLGHVRPLLAIAERLAAAGHRPVLALKDIFQCWPITRGSAVPVIPGPFLPRPAPKGFLAATFSDVLAVRGFGQVEDLAPLVAAWDRLIELTNAELIITDHAPSLCLAAYGRLPIVCVGTGFALPPSVGQTFPVIQPAAQPTATSGDVLAVARHVAERRGFPAPETLPGLFAQARLFIKTLLELDPYRRIRTTVDAGPLLPLPPRSRTSPVEDFFAYLAPDYAGIAPLFETLAKLGLRGSAYVRGGGPDMRQLILRPGVRVHETPPQIADALGRARILIHHAGAGTSQEGLAVGRPQLLLPRQVEQGLTANALAEMGVGVALPLQHSRSALEQSVCRLLTDDHIRHRAEEWAERLEQRDERNILDAVVTCCLESLPARHAGE